MTAEEARDWLKVAVAEVLSFPAAALWQAATEAKRTCTHHAQIVPTVIAAIEKRQAEHRSLEEASASIPPALPPPRLSDEEFETIVADRGLALSALLDRGVIISNGDGTFRRADDAA